MLAPAVRNRLLTDILQRFAEAERRRSEQKLAEWKEQLKKATMIVIKKQVDSARAKCEGNKMLASTHANTVLIVSRLIKTAVVHIELSWITL